jgi:hypothetical protein
MGSIKLVELRIACVKVKPWLAQRKTAAYVWLTELIFDDRQEAGRRAESAASEDD